MKYSFSNDCRNDEYIKVETTDKYFPVCFSETEYGFWPHGESFDSEYLKIPEINDGYGVDERFFNHDVYSLKTDDFGTGAVYNGEGGVPVTFAVSVKETGNYVVNVTLYATEDAKEVLIFQSRRRLGGILDIKKGEYRKVSFVTNVSPIIPRYHEEVVEDHSVNITLIGKNVYLYQMECEKWEGPTVYIAGDSTVTDQTGTYPYLPERCYCGWGQMLSGFLNTDMAVSNHAHSGLTTESFRSEGHYDNLKTLLKKGDYCLFQFGHNDQKLESLKADEGYKERLIQYINEMKQIGVIPVIVSPLARNTWKGTGEYNDLLKEYARVCEEVSISEKVKFIDLHKMSMELILKLGVEEAKRYFYPSDYTHTNDYGAYLFAGYIHEELTGKRTHAYKFNPPLELRSINVSTEDLDTNSTKEADASLLKDIDRPNDYLKRYEALDFAIQTLKYFPTNVYNDMFTDIVGHEVYAGVVECAYQNGIIPSDWIKDNKISPDKDISYKELFDCLNAGVMSRTGSGLKLDTKSINRDSKVKRIDAAKWCRLVRTKI